MTSYEKTLRAAMELLDDMHAKMSVCAFKSFEADIYHAIAETYGVEMPQVREDMEDFHWMISGAED